MTESERIAEALAEPFDPQDVKFKPQRVKGNEAMVVAYVDARAVQNRLDTVLGVIGWQDSYELLPDGSVKCELAINFGTEQMPNWIKKSDVGGQSEQPDGGDRMKSAFSDALKRAAVKFGCGRFLYTLGFVWWPYDPVKKELIDADKLRATLPRPKGAARQIEPTVVVGQTSLPPAARPASQDKPDQLGERMMQAIREGGTRAMAKLWEKEFTQDERKAFQGRLDGAKKAAAKQDEVIREREDIKGWTDWLKANPSLSEFNEMLPKTANLSANALKIVGEAIDRHAEANGLVYDETRGLFFPRKAG